MPNWERLPIFEKRLRAIIGPDHFNAAWEGFSAERSVCIRINTLKTTIEAADTFLKSQSVEVLSHPSCSEARILQGIEKRAVTDWEPTREGQFYIQSLSSMLATVALDPRPGERVLDLCAAPGSKTSHIGARMENTGELFATELVRNRYFRLRSVLDLMRVTHAQALCKDARRFMDADGFGRILVDAPCSSEGRIRFDDPDSYAYWSERKIKEMVHKQKGLVVHAARLLKPGGTLVYATCTSAPEENENVVSYLLKKSPDLQLLPTDIPSPPSSYPALNSWKGRDFHPDTEHCLRIMPGPLTDGFFIAKFQKTA